jgi:DNA-binding NarL/FixJ family response regulator
VGESTLPFVPTGSGRMGARILIADDHEGARAAVADIIGSSGEDWCVCGQAADGRSAVQMALEGRPDLVILDVRMPNLDGMQAAHEIRALMPGVRILFYTLLATPRLEAAARTAGFEVVAKPDTAGLIAAIRRLNAGDAGPKDTSRAKAAPQG